MTNKQRVLKKYPKAYCRIPFPSPRYFRVRTRDLGPVIGYHETSANGAWADAARRLKS